MIKEQELDYLKQLVSRNTIKPLRGHQKKAYKYVLCAIFINLIGGNGLQRGQEENYKLADSIRRGFNITEITYESIESEVKKSLRFNSFKPPYNEDFINKVIEFFRLRLDEVAKNKRSLFKAEHLNSIMNIDKHYGENGFRLYNHHWMEFDLDLGLIPTYPEYIIFTDLKIQWNYYIDNKEKLNELLKTITDKKSKIDFYKQEKNREVELITSSLRRTLIFTGVTFTESYLYDLFYNLKSNKLPGKEKIIKVFKKERVNDTDVIERVLFELYPSIKGSIETLYKNYKEVLNIRDRYVHASPFVDPSDRKTSQILPLLTLNHEKLIDSLQTCVDLVREIDQNLPENLQLLFWLKENIVFDNQKLNVTNKDSNLNKMVY